MYDVIDGAGVLSVFYFVAVRTLLKCCSLLPAFTPARWIHASHPCIQTSQIIILGSFIVTSLFVAVLCALPIADAVQAGHTTCR